MNSNIKRRLTSRKFLGGFTLMGLSLGLLLWGAIDPSQWVQLNIAVYGIYAGSNALSKFPEKFSKSPEQSNLDDTLDNSGVTSK